MDIETMLKDIGIQRKGNMTRSGAYMIDLEDSEDFGRFYSLLDRSNKVRELDDNNINNIHTIVLLYIYKNLQITLSADLDEDKYSLVATPISEEDIEEPEEEEEETDEEEDEE